MRKYFNGKTLGRKTTLLVERELYTEGRNAKRLGAPQYTYAETRSARKTTMTANDCHPIQGGRETSGRDTGGSGVGSCGKTCLVRKNKSNIQYH